MIISIDAGKVFEKIQHLLMIPLQKANIIGTYFNILKAIYVKPISSSMFNGEQLKVLPLKSGKRQGCSLSPQLFNNSLEVLSTTVREEK